jgi:hypothetical protein
MAPPRRNRTSRLAGAVRLDSILLTLKTRRPASSDRPHRRERQHSGLPTAAGFSNPRLLRQRHHLEPRAAFDDYLPFIV